MTQNWTVVPFVAPADAAEAERIQESLRERVLLPQGRIETPATVTGVDISYAVGSRRAVAAAATVEVHSLRVREVATAEQADIVSRQVLRDSWRGMT